MIKVKRNRVEISGATVDIFYDFYLINKGMLKVPNMKEMCETSIEIEETKEANLRGNKEFFDDICRVFLKHLQKEVKDDKLEFRDKGVNRDET